MKYNIVLIYLRLLVIISFYLRIGCKEQKKQLSVCLYNKVVHWELQTCRVIRFLLGPGSTMFHLKLIRRLN